MQIWENNDYSASAAGPKNSEEKWHVTLKQNWCCFFLSGMNTPFKNTIFSQLKFTIDMKLNVCLLFRT